jgi:hypothetical protein
VTNLRPETLINCEPEHIFPVAGREKAEI